MELLNIGGTRVLCVAECRGALSRLNEVAAAHKASAIIHTGSFGFFDGDSAASMTAKSLRQAAAFSPLVDTNGNAGLPTDEVELRERVGSQLSELPLFLAGARRFVVPVYAVWGVTEDVAVLEKFRDGTYSVDNLHILDERNAPRLPGTTVRLMGLGGAVVPSQLFDNGDGRASIAGTCGNMWVSIWQMGELLQSVLDGFDPSETHVFVSHSSPANHPLLEALAISLRSDIAISSGSHQRYTASFSQYALDPSFASFDRRLNETRSQLSQLWKQVETQVLKITEANLAQRSLITTVIDVLTTPPQGKALTFFQDAHENLWYFNLADIDHGTLLLQVEDGKIAAETSSVGFDFSKRTTNPRQPRKTRAAFARELRESREAREPKEAKEPREPKEPKELKEPRELREPRDPKEPKEPKEHHEVKESRDQNDSQDSKDFKEQIESYGQEPTEATDENGYEKDGSEPKEGFRDFRALKDPKFKDRSFARDSNERLKDLKDIKDRVRRRKDDDKDTVRREKRRPDRPGVWFRDGDRSREEILELFDPEDRSLSRDVVFDENTRRADGVKFTTATVFFDTLDKAAQAYGRIDKSKAGTFSIAGSGRKSPKAR